MTQQRRLPMRMIAFFLIISFLPLYSADADTFFNDREAFVTARTTKLGYSSEKTTRPIIKRKVVARCKHGQIKINNVCVLCSELMENCETCSSGTVCVACKKGYKIKDGLCKKTECSSSEECKDNQICQEEFCVDLTCSGGQLSVGHACQKPAEPSNPK